MTEKEPQLNKRKLHRGMQENAVNLVSVINRICDRHEYSMPHSAGDLAHARRLMKFLEEDIQKIESDSKP